MPRITFMYWNVQDFGDNSPRYRGNYQPLANFIAKVAKNWNADIFALVELRQNGVAQLNRVRGALNAAYLPAQRHWHYDWIKGSYEAPPPPPPLGLPPPAPANAAFVNQDQLAWSLAAHGEGYALFWNALPDGAEKFTMVSAPVGNRQSGGAPPGTAPGSGVDCDLGGVAVAGAAAPGGLVNVLRLVGEGRGPTAAGGPGWYTAPPFVPGMAFPLADLNFPLTWLTRLVQRPSRRPAYFVARLNLTAGGGTAQQRLTPFVVYHAPSMIGAGPGTEVSAFSRHLYETENAGGWVEPDHAVACGDYNVDQNDPGAGIAYAAYLNAFGAGGAGMAAVVTGPNANNLKTTVQLSRGFFGPDITSGRVTDYLSLAIDNVFVRGFPGGTTPVPPRGNRLDLLTAVMPGGSMTGAPVRAFLPILTAATPLGTPYDVAGNPLTPLGFKLYPRVLDWRALLTGVAAGQFAGARQAAEFVRLFISDHLPLAFSFNV